MSADSLQPHGLYSPWNSLGQNTKAGSYSLLQGIFPTQGSTQVSHIADRRAPAQGKSQGTTNWFQIGKGVRQGCILSTCLFNLYVGYNPWSRKDSDTTEQLHFLSFLSIPNTYVPSF